MINIRKLSDCHLLTHDPDLQREVISYLLYCQYELLEYGDATDDLDDFNFMVLTEEDLSMLKNLGVPEKTIQINIKADGHIITLYRTVYPTEVIFIPNELSKFMNRISRNNK